MITGLVLCAVRGRLLEGYCVLWGNDYWLGFVCVGAVNTGLALCAVRGDYWLVLSVVGQ